MKLYVYGMRVKVPGQRPDLLPRCGRAYCVCSEQPAPRMRAENGERTWNGWVCLQGENKEGKGVDMHGQQGGSGG